MVKTGPDYRALRAEKLGIPWDQDIDLSGVTDPPVPQEPEIPTTTNQTPVAPTPPAQTPAPGADQTPEAKTP